MMIKIIGEIATVAGIMAAAVIFGVFGGFVIADIVYIFWRAWL